MGGAMSGAVPLRAGDLRLATATTTFDGMAGSGATGTVDVFDITGHVALHGFAVVCTDDLEDSVDGAVLDIGVTGFADRFWDGSATPTDLDDIDAGVWFSVEAVVLTTGVGSMGAAYDGSQGFERFPLALSAANILYTIATQAITGGTLVAYALWSPLSADGNLVAS